MVGSFLRLRVDVSHSKSFINLWEKVTSKLDLENLELFIVFAWFIWNNKNERLWNSAFKDLGKLINQAISYIKEMRQTYSGN